MRSAWRSKETKDSRECVYRNFRAAEIAHNLDPMRSSRRKFVLEQFLKRRRCTSVSPCVDSGNRGLAVEVDLDVPVGCTPVSDEPDMRA